MKRLVFCSLSLFLLIETTAMSSAACDENAATTVTGTMNTQLAALVGFTMVQCLPSTDAGKCSILCVTTSLEKEDNVNILLIAITASAAVNMRKVGISKFSKIQFADKNLLQQRHYLAVPANRADQFQASIANANYTPLQLMALVRREYSEQAMPEKK